MDAVGQSYNIIVTGANNDTCMRRNNSVESDKVAPIKRQHRSASLVGGKHIMAKLTQALHNGITEILVYVQRDHRLCVCCLLDGSINRLAMRGIVDPGGV